MILTEQDHDRLKTREHKLKTDPYVFQRVWDGKKTFEIRYNDRQFQEGEILWLLETRFTGEEMKAGAPLKYTGRQISLKVTDVLVGPIYGLMQGWALLSFEKIDNFS